MIERNRYVERLAARRHDGLVKVITGLRRCGKSFLLFNLFREFLAKDGVDDAHVIGIDLEDGENATLRNPNRLLKHIVRRLPGDGRWTYVFIDEVQMCRKVPVQGVSIREVAPEDRADAYVTFYDVLNSLRKKPMVDVYVTGSNSKLLSKDVATNFRDRGVEIRLAPLTFAEFFPICGTADKSEALSRYLIWGGMPRAVLEQDDVVRAEYLKGLFTQVYLKDIRERNQLKSVETCERVLDAICSNTGSLTNPHKLVNTLRSEGGFATSERTMQKHLEYFCDAFLFAKVDRYDIRGKRYLAYPQKYYVMDVGLRNARLNFREDDEARLMENVIYNELVVRGYNVDVGVVEVKALNRNGKGIAKHYEIDFVINAGFNKVYIQSAYAMNTPEKVRQEKSALMHSGDFFQKIIVESGYRDLRPDENGIFRVGIIPFLLDAAILDGIIREAKSSRRKMVEGDGKVQLDGGFG